MTVNSVSAELPDWPAEYADLQERDGQSELPPEDLERFAVVATMLGRDDEVTALRERALAAYLAHNQVPEAVKCGFWLGFHLQNRGAQAHSSGLLARVRRLVPDDGPAGLITGLLTIADAATLMASGNVAQALELFDRGSRIAHDLAERDVFVVAECGRARCLVLMGKPDAATATLDEVMAHITAGGIAPQLTGFAYCATLDLSMRRHDIRRAQEWTQALTRWCDLQSGMVPYRGACLVHRAEILELRGAWSEAAVQARQACDWLPPSGPVAGSAHYRLAEIERMQGRFAEADAAYQRAAECGFEVQPGLARLRASQGRLDVAIAGLDRALAEDPDSPARPVMQIARVDLGLAANDLASARAAADDVAKLARNSDAPYVLALAAYGEGAVLLAEGEPQAAMPHLRRAWALWQQVDAPYEAARTRLLVGAACRAMGDHDAEQMEIDAARSIFERLGAVVDLSRVSGGWSGPKSGREPERGSARGSEPSAHPLTPRELEVLRLLATGATNKQIAHHLILSDKTVSRHVANIFGKLGVASRAAATAYAYEHGLS